MRSARTNPRLLDHVQSVDGIRIAYHRKSLGHERLPRSENSASIASGSKTQFNCMRASHAGERVHYRYLGSLGSGSFNNPSHDASPPSTTMSSIPILLSVAAAAWVWLVLFKHRRRNTPPGPRPLPLIGNLLDFSFNELWLRVTTWSEQYGMFVTRCVCRLHANVLMHRR